MSTQAGVFVLTGDQSIIPMQPAQFATEAQFQDLLARFPILLVGDQIAPENPRRWVLVKREQAVGLDDASGGRWSIDHVFLDQDGIPTLVEIKRQTDTRIRREVVGQMLDYAANCATFWTPGSLRSSFEQTCMTAQRQSGEVLAELFGAEGDPNSFWAKVDGNLAEGRIRMLFVADIVPIELRRIVEFLNKQMNPAEVLAIELRQFEGQGLRTIVPMVLGALDSKAGVREKSSAGVIWDEQKILTDLATRTSEAEVQIAKEIIACMRQCGEGLVFGTARNSGSVYPLLRPKGRKINPIYLSSYGNLCFGFGWLKDKPIFEDVEMRRRLIEHLITIPNVDIRDDDLDRYPSILLSVLAADAASVSKLRSTFAWLGEVVRQAR